MRNDRETHMLGKGVKQRSNFIVDRIIGRGYMHIER